MSYEYDEALQASVEYFGGNELAAKVFVDKYALRDNDGNLLEKTPEDMHWRLANEFARIEGYKYKQSSSITPMSAAKIFSYLDRFRKIIPQGSPMYGIGNDYQTITISNCYVVESPEDSFGGIHLADEYLSQISKRRGGVGLDISKLRPNGSVTHNSARTSTGIVPFLERFSNTIREVGQSGRRGALMVTLSVHHPEVLEFASIKRNLTKVTGANISVRLTDEFLQAVDEGKDYELRWPVDSSSPAVSKMVDARQVWHSIIENAHAMAEPGLLFWDNIINQSPADCYTDEGFRTISTNPCSELPLCSSDSCRLLLLNLIAYVVNPFTNKSYFDFDSFYNDSQIAQRLMDDMVDLEIEKIDKILSKIVSDPEPCEIKETELRLWQKIREKCSQGRRTGTGITALGDTIAALGLGYASPEAIDLSERIYRTLKLGCYRASVDMAKSIGPFPVWNLNNEHNCRFLNRLKDEDYLLWEDMQKYGRRNIALLTTAPAGSVSILAKALFRHGTSSGIEPQFSISPYIRRKKVNPNDSGVRVDFVDKNGDSWQHFEVYPGAVKDWMDVTGETDITKSPWAGFTASDLNWKDRVLLQSRITKHLDHSVSSTLNLPNDVSVEQVAEIYEHAWKMGCKGITVYREGCRDGVLINKESNNNKTLNRPRELPCDVHHIKVRHKEGDDWITEEYFVLVGMKKDEPYEVFAGKNGCIPNEIQKGIITKVRSHYKVEFEGYDTISDINDFVKDNEEALTRLVSLNLRSGIGTHAVVKQLEKVTGDLQSFAKSMSRALKKYIPDGTPEGEKCPNCSGKLIRQEGCVTCENMLAGTCTYTKCG